MKAQDLKILDSLRFDPADGSLKIKERRLVLYDVGSFGLMRSEILESIGLDRTRRILTRFGFSTGYRVAQRLGDIYSWDNLEEWIKAGAVYHTLHGIVKATVEHLRADPLTGQFHMKLKWENSSEAEEHLQQIGRTDHAVCWMLVGYASGYASACFGRNVYFIEDKCRAKGDPYCTAEGMTRKEWGARIVPYVQYFEFEDVKEIVARLENDLREKEAQLLRREMELAKALKKSDRENMEMGRSRAFRDIVGLAEQVARYNTSVLITGESGTGKEVIARHIHALSNRADGPFVGVNCGAIPETLLESELFGHVKGAFTGAVADRKGLFEQAKAGTLLLDEIGEVSPAMQVKLLRVLQEREVVPVGTTKSVKVDVRILATTNRNIEKMVQNGTFRQDLYYRLKVIQLTVPPLRERPEDIMPLAQRFLERYSTDMGKGELRLSVECANLLMNYAWPGNVRELENSMEHAVVLAEDAVIRPRHLPPEIYQALSTPIQKNVGRLSEMEKETITNALRQTGGNRAKAAAILGIGTSTLYRKLRKYHIKMAFRHGDSGLQG